MGNFTSGAAGSLVSGVLGIISNSKTNAANAEINRSNQRFQHAEAELAYRRQRQLIQEQNQYNSYSNQRQLMENAGYNPYNLVGGTAGTAVSSSSTNAPQAGSPSAVPMQQLDAATIGALSDAALKAAQVRNLDQDTNKLKMDESFVKVQKDYQEFANTLFKDYGRLEKNIYLNLADAQRAYYDGMRNFNNIQSDLAHYDLKTIKPAEFANIVADTSSKRFQSALYEAETAKTDAERKTILRKCAFEISLMQAQARSYIEQANLFHQQSLGQGISNELWGLGGLFRSRTETENNILNNDYELSGMHLLRSYHDQSLWSQNIHDYDKVFKETLRGEVERATQSADWARRRNIPIVEFFFDTFDEVGHMWSGAGLYQLGQSGYNSYKFSNRPPIGFRNSK